MRVGITKTGETMRAALSLLEDIGVTVQPFLLCGSFPFPRDCETFMWMKSHSRFRVLHCPLHSIFVFELEAKDRETEGKPLVPTLLSSASS